MKYFFFAKSELIYAYVLLYYSYYMYYYNNFVIEIIVLKTTKSVFMSNYYFIGDLNIELFFLNILFTCIF